MFGYVVIDKPNILIKDFATYRSFYCGLCKTIGSRSGQAMRLTLNYDIVLLALLGHNYEEREPEFSEGRCIVHPFGKKLSYVKSNDILARIADINAILGYYKLMDDVIDERKHRALKNAVKPVYKKAARRLPQLDKAVGSGYEKLRALEKAGGDLARTAETFGLMLSACGDALTEKCDRTLREFLFYLGQWVYAVDAYDDIKKDFGKAYNPFLRDVKAIDDIFYNEAERRAREFMFDKIDRLTECYNRMKIGIAEGPLSNIIYLGLKQRTEYVIKKRGEKWPKVRL